MTFFYKTEGVKATFLSSSNKALIFSRNQWCRHSTVYGLYGRLLSTSTSWSQKVRSHFHSTKPKALHQGNFKHSSYLLWPIQKEKQVLIFGLKVVCKKSQQLTTKKIQIVALSEWTLNSKAKPVASKSYPNYLFFPCLSQGYGNFHATCLKYIWHCAQLFIYLIIYSFLILTTKAWKY